MEKNLDLKLAWMGALYGVLAQVVWINSGFLRDGILDLFHSMMSRKRNDKDEDGSSVRWRKAR